MNVKIRDIIADVAADYEDDHIALAASVLQALDAAGYVVVPKEPTKEMIAACMTDEMCHLSDVLPNDQFLRDWRAMIAATNDE